MLDAKNNNSIENNKLWWHDHDQGRYNGDMASELRFN